MAHTLRAEASSSAAVRIHLQIALHIDQSLSSSLLTCCAFAVVWLYLLLGDCSKVYIAKSQCVMQRDGQHYCYIRCACICAHALLKGAATFTNGKLVVSHMSQIFGKLLVWRALTTRYRWRCIVPS
jgi:hypothetical protein